MRICDFKLGDKIRITRTNLRGTIIKIGGMYATIKINDYSEITMYISRLRHIESLAQRKIKEAEEIIENAKKMIRRSL